MHEKTVALQKRTHTFAVQVIQLCESLPERLSARRIAEQLIDSAGSTDSNYRAACRARSLKEFVAKLGVAIEEADESKGWLELLLDSKLAAEEPCSALIKEADELTRIFVASRKTAEANLAARSAARSGPIRQSST